VGFTIPLTVAITTDHSSLLVICFSPSSDLSTCWLALAHNDAGDMHNVAILLIAVYAMSETLSRLCLFPFQCTFDFPRLGLCQPTISIEAISSEKPH
jgi:hypothetical protein